MHCHHQKLDGLSIFQTLSLVGAIITDALQKALVRARYFGFKLFHKQWILIELHLHAHYNYQLNRLIEGYFLGLSKLFNFGDHFVRQTERNFFFTGRLEVVLMNVKRLRQLHQDFETRLGQVRFVSGYLRPRNSRLRSKIALSHRFLCSEASQALSKALVHLCQFMANSLK